MNAELQAILDGITEQDAYRRQAAIRKTIEDYAASQLPPVADGYTRTITSVNYETGEATYSDRLTSEIVAEQVAAEKARMIALMTPSLIQLAALYRSVLRRVTGDATAETNRKITRETVATIFLGAIANGSMTDELRDAQALLQFGFDWLSPIVGANPPNTWDLPWEVVP